MSSVNDPTSDMLTRIRNAAMVGKRVRVEKKTGKAVD